MIGDFIRYLVELLFSDEYEDRLNVMEKGTNTNMVRLFGDDNPKTNV